MSKGFWTRSEPFGGTRDAECPKRFSRRAISLRIAKGCVQFGSVVLGAVLARRFRAGRYSDAGASEVGRSDVLSWAPGYEGRYTAETIEHVSLHYGPSNRLTFAGLPVVVDVRATDLYILPDPIVAKVDGSGVECIEGLCVIVSSLSVLDQVEERYVRELACLMRTHGGFG